MPPKKQLPAPIDRPLSRAYLREFTGWSPEYPPGISDPTSLRVMENTQVQRDGSMRIRPGLRYLSVGQVVDPVPLVEEPIGTHEPFFLNNNSKAYLFAVREAGGEVGFRVLANTGLGLVVQSITAPGVGFTLPQGYAALCLSAATTYVKYLQIDNNIYALGNAGDTMRLFEVGELKRAKTLNPIARPNWDSNDKLTVVHPGTAWVNSGVPTGYRNNLVLNPSFETSTYAWTGNSSVCKVTQSTAHSMAGGVASLRTEGKAPFKNYMVSPLDSAQGAWTEGADLPPGSIYWDGTWLFSSIANSCGTPRWLDGPYCYGMQGGHTYNFRFDWERSNVAAMGMQLMYRWFGSSGAQIGADTYVGGPAIDGGFGPYNSGTVDINIVAPAGAVRFVPFINGIAYSCTPGSVEWHRIRHVMLADITEDMWYGYGFFDGNSGAGFHWSGAANNSTSYYYDPAGVQPAFGYSQSVAVSAGADYNVSGYLKAGTTGRNWRLYLHFYTAGFGANVGTYYASGTDVNTTFTRLSKQITAPPGAAIMMFTFQCTDLIPQGEYHYLDNVLVENTLTLGNYFDGGYTDLSTLIYDWYGAAHTSMSREMEFSAPATIPAPTTPTVDTLISSDPTKNVYSAGFFYTFSNEIGETAASQVTVVKMQRGWSQWKWELGTAGAPNGTATVDPAVCADQLVAYMPPSVFDDAIAQGAVKWSLYMCTWSNQDPAPVQAVRLSTRELPLGSTHGSRGWQRMTPQQADANAEVSGLPSEVNRYNYSNPSRGAQGIVAADRLVMVYDPVDAAVIRWSSGQMGNYSDFSASRGGGYKTLTTGNMQVPACVKLWQNPQSADTLTILCLGTDGYSTGYYMAPAQIASQSEATNIMGFEETTATPGTVSPFGVEVMNNALYHPLDEQIMKSTATNYNINHSSITDAVQTVWRGVKDKSKIVSSMHDSRLYYLVHNPRGAPLEAGCWGNEIWVFDGQAKAGSWCRWLVQGKSLRKFEQGDEIVMSLIRPDGIYYFDENYAIDDYVTPLDEIEQRNIPWQIETNTQGANRAHDAWAHLQQVSIMVGNFQGAMRYGVRGLDFNGKRVDVSKVLRDTNPPSPDGLPYDLEDFLQIRRDMKEWFFYAESVTDEENVVQHSEGQINLVQYRYTPSTVNTGYEFGSIETFEYTTQQTHSATNGIPIPYIDTARP